MLVSLEEKRAFFAELLAAGDLDAARAFCERLRDESAGDERLRWGNNLSIVELRAGRLDAALEALASVADEAHDTRDHLLRANCHNNAAAARIGRWKLSESEADLDAALIELEGARFHYREAREFSRLGTVENNLGALRVALGDYEEAVRHTAAAREVYTRSGERGLVAQVDETEARARLGLKEYGEAERLASLALAFSEGESAKEEARETLRAVWAAMGCEDSPDAPLRKVG